MITPGRLAEVRSFDDLLVFLAEDLDWPIHNLDLEDAAFDYEPEELGIEPTKAPKLETIRELRPLQANQPWGIFFLEFTGTRLPVLQLRLVLDRLVTKKRARGDGSNRSWDLDDLLFLITTNTSADVELHLVAFKDVGNPLPEVRSLPWSSGHPNSYLKRLETELLPQLAWPEHPDDTDDWREQWRAAFQLRHGEAITTATRLADRMADVARNVREVIEHACEQEDGHGPFNLLLKEIRDELISDAEESEFADMCAQTLVYGLLTARINDPVTFGASPLLSSVPLSNPFLAAFFQKINEHVLELEVEDSGIEALIVDLQSSNVEHVLDQFGATGSYSDPVIHFYEEFLKKYDNVLKIAVGAFYTPLPIVKFMIRSIDQILRTEFGLDDGVADRTTWAGVADRKGFKVPSSIDPASPFVSMIDPATGTGTFLIEWLRQAKESFSTNHSETEWPEHFAEQVTPSMHAFELMLGPYAIAHLKLALESSHDGIAMDPNTVLLTDTLEHNDAQLQAVIFDDPVAAEGLRAKEIKDGAHLTVCIGNPPYNRSANEITTGWIGDRSNGPSLFDDFLEPLSAAGLGVHAKLIHEQSIYFWRWALWKIFEQNRSPGILSFISPRAYIDSPGHSGMRKWMRETLDELWIIDLGGDNRGANRSPNVFDIETGVAIGIGVRYREPAPNQPARIWYHEVTGSSEEKLRTLSTSTRGSLEWTECPGVGLDLFLPSGPEEYEKWPDVNQLFPWRISGSQYKRLWPIGEDPETLGQRWDRLKNISSDYQLASKSSAQADQKAKLARLRTAFGETRDRLVSDAPEGRTSKKHTGFVSLDPSDPMPQVIDYAYRAFDRRYVLWDERVGDFIRSDLAATRSNQQIFFGSLMTKQLGFGPSMTATNRLPDMDFFCNRGAADILPMWRDAAASRPNVTTGLLAVLQTKYGQPPLPEDLFAYVMAIMGSPSYQKMFEDGLRRPGPCIPITKDRRLFLEGVRLGRQLVYFQTYGCRWGTEDQPSDHLPPGKAELTIEIPDTVEGYPKSYEYDEPSQTLIIGDGAISHVERSVFEYEQSGFRVVRSWLGYRMQEGAGRATTSDASELNAIRPTTWQYSEELLELLWAIEGCVGLWTEIDGFLREVVKSETFDADDLPEPQTEEKKKPRPSPTSENQLFE